MSHTSPSEASFNVERNVPHHQNNSIITQVNDSLTNITKMSHTSPSVAPLINTTIDNNISTYINPIDITTTSIIHPLSFYLGSRPVVTSPLPLGLSSFLVECIRRAVVANYDRIKLLPHNNTYAYYDNATSSNVTNNLSLLHEVTVLIHPIPLGGVGGLCNLTHVLRLYLLPVTLDLNICYYSVHLPATLSALASYSDVEVITALTPNVHVPMLECPHHSFYHPLIPHS
jgi:hypothetical protein